jgi:predicted Fe-S protein YdhL (DUF1289 family)
MFAPWGRERCDGRTAGSISNGCVVSAQRYCQGCPATANERYARTRHTHPLEPGPLRNFATRAADTVPKGRQAVAAKSRTEAEVPVTVETTGVDVFRGADRLSGPREEAAPRTVGCTPVTDLPTPSAGYRHDGTTDSIS